MSTIDYTQDQKAVLLSLINQCNNTILSPADFDFSIPAVYSNPQSKFNTSIVLTAKAGTGYYGEREIYYNRIEINDVLSKTSLNYNPQIETKVSQLLPRINAVYGLHLKLEDIYETDIPAFDVNQPYQVRDVTLLIKPESFFYTGNYTFSFGIVTTPITENDGKDRTYFAVIDGYSVNESQLGLIALKADGQPDPNFHYLSNVSNITVFDRQQVFRLTTGEFIFNGHFTFDYCLSAGAPKISISGARSIFVDISGQVTGSSASLYCDGIPQNYLTHSKVPYFYFNAVGLSYPGNVARYTEEGIIDASFNAAMQYDVDLIRISPDNKIYTVSKLFLTPDPFNNDILTMQRRIDRMLSDGSKDPNFNTIYLKISQPNQQPLPIFDLTFSETGGFYIVFNPVYSTDINSACPVINNVPLVNLNPLALSAYSWNPVVYFNEDGSQSSTFKNELKLTYSGAVWQSNLNPMIVGKPALVAMGGKVTFFTFAANPITGYVQRRPIQFDNVGNITLLSGLEYANQYKWVDLSDIQIQTNGKILAVGKVQTPNMEGFYSAPYNALVRYNANTTIDSVLWRSPGPTGTSNPVIKQLYFDEK